MEVGTGLGGCAVADAAAGGVGVPLHGCVGAFVGAGAFTGVAEAVIEAGEAVGGILGEVIDE